MPAPRPLTGPRRRIWLGRTALAIVAVAAVWGFRELNRPARPTLEGLATTTVHRADFGSILRAGGVTESAENTVIECQLERLEMRSEGQSSMVGGSSVILWVIDDGSTVKKGDVLCRLDSSDYEELVRQQEIKVERARSDHLQAGLTHEVARESVREYREGLVAQTIQEQQGLLTMAESDIVRARDRLAWIEKMRGKGYASEAMLSTADHTVKQAEHEAMKARTTLDLFRRYEAPRQIQTLEAAVKSARADLSYFALRLGRFEERLAYYRKMVENCTIHAPNDGFVIYVPPKLWSNEAPIEAGSRVRQMQDLFLLPDLSRMRVAAMIHESVMPRVRPGMTVRAKIEGLSGRVIEGHVLGVNPLPDAQSSWLSDLKSFKATIQLDGVPRGIRPQMTAEVEIDIDRRSDVIAVPVEAVAVVGGKDYCYVASDGMLERRPIKLGDSDQHLLEVTDGLEEGEEVVSDVSVVDRYAPLVVDAPAGPGDPARDVAQASGPGPSDKAGL